ncbi:hypothetical protein MMC17_008410 [Xylographa soralifera]|nr:hypothetical protein [Xylographa soralifera]
MLGLTISSSKSTFDSIEHDEGTEKKRSVSDIEVSASTNVIFKCEKPENIDKALERPAAILQLSKTEMVESVAQTRNQLAPERQLVGIGTYKHEEPYVATEDRASSSANGASMPNPKAISASGVEERGTDCQIAELQWRNTMWKSLSAEHRKRNKISSALSKLRSTMTWQKATLLDKIRMNELEICRVSTLAGRSFSSHSKHFNRAPLHKTKFKAKGRPISGTTENNVGSASHEERQSNSQMYIPEESFVLQEVRKTPPKLVETCPLSRERKYGARFVTGLVRDFTKSLEMATDVYGDIPTIVKEAIKLD